MEVSANIRSELECPVCFELPRDPVRLACPHHVCGSCARALVRRVLPSKTLECPLCMTAMPLKRSADAEAVEEELLREARRGVKVIDDDCHMHLRTL